MLPWPVLLAGYLLSLGVIVHLVLRRQDPTATLAWALWIIRDLRLPAPGLQVAGQGFALVRITVHGEEAAHLPAARSGPPQQLVPFEKRLSAASALWESTRRATITCCSFYAQIGPGLPLACSLLEPTRGGVK